MAGAGGRLRETWRCAFTSAGRLEPAGSVESVEETETASCTFTPTLMQQPSLCIWRFTELIIRFTQFYSRLEDTGLSIHLTNCLITS